jgi:DNA-binding NarL/FixJ family response regulator
MNPRISILAGSDLPHVSHQVNTCFKSTPDLQLVGIAPDGAGLLQMAKLHRPAVALMCLSVRQTALKTLVSALAADGVCPALISDVLEDAEVLELLQYGLVGVLPTAVTDEMLRHSVHAMAAGEIWIRRDMIGKLIEQLRGSCDVAPVSAKVQEKTNYRPKPQIENQFSLTQRELQIVQATSEGLTNKEIASALDISEFTVKHHLAKIFDKLGVYSRLELATFAIHHHLYRQSATPQLATVVKSTASGRDIRSTF